MVKTAQLKYHSPYIFMDTFFFFIASEIIYNNFLFCMKMASNCSENAVTCTVLCKQSEDI